EIGRPAAPSVPLVTRLAAAWPNPFQRSTTLSLELANRGPVELSIYSVDGRLVKTLAHGEFEPGVYQWSWSGDDGRGGTAAAGIYFVRLSTREAKVTRRLVCIR